MRLVSIQLTARKSSAKARLDFAELPVEGRQTRLQGRTVLHPELDLDLYSCRAVIDWVDLVFTTVRPSQWKWVKKRIDDASAGNCHIEGRRDEDTAEFREFRVRFQEPEFKNLMIAERAVSDGWGLQGPAAIENLEVSVDFTPKVPSGLSLARMYGALVRTHLPGRDVISEQRDRPRFSWGEGNENTAHVLPLSKNSPERNDELLMSIDKDQPAAIDATYYVGAHGSCSAWRVMIKVMDRQNRRSKARLDLPESKRRVRIEATLDRDELRRIGIKSLEDLKTFPFQTLQGGYFQFRLPTFVDASQLPSDPHPAITAAWQKQRRAKFLNSGVVGLKAMDEANDRIRKSNRKEMKKTLQPGRTLKPVRRAGTGSNGSLVAYEALTRRVLMALRHLGNRVRASNTDSSR